MFVLDCVEHALAVHAVHVATAEAETILAGSVMQRSGVDTTKLGFCLVGRPSLRGAAPTLRRQLEIPYRRLWCL